MNRRLPSELIFLVIGPHASTAKFVCRQWRNMLSQKGYVFVPEKDIYYSRSPPAVAKWALANGLKIDTEHILAEVKEGHATGVDLLFLSDASFSFRVLIHKLVRGGHINVLERLYVNGFDNWKIIYSDATWMGQIPVLEWVVSRKSNFTIWNAVAIAKKAAKAFQIYVLEWIYYRWPGITRYHNICRVASWRDGLEILQWLRDPEARDDGSVFDWDERTVDVNFAGNNCRAWALANGCPTQK
jgi:hypothetical protein